MSLPIICAVGLVAAVGFAVLLWIVTAAIDAEFNSEPTDQNYL